MRGPDFFIVGCSRSGTSLLSVLLDRHSRLCVPPETSFFAEVYPRLTRDGGQELSEVIHGWKRLRELNLKPEDVVRRLGDRFDDPGRVLAAVLDLYAAARGKSRCGEKTPQHLESTPEILRLFPQASIFCLLRDGRDVALSLAAMPWWTPRSLVDAAAFWKRSADLAANFRRDYPERFHIIRYEDLVNRVEEVLGEIMAVLGEWLEPRQLDPAVSSDVVLPRSMTWKADALGPIRSSGETGRRSTATGEQLAVLDRSLGEHLRRYGYAA